MRPLRELIETYDVGDKLTDKELDHCIDHFNKLVDLLLGMGPKWYLPFKEANSIRIRMEDMKKARLSWKS